MASDYIPASDAAFDAWSYAFNTNVSANGATQGLTIAEASAIGVAQGAWHDAYIAATDPSTRTIVTIATKDDNRASFTILIRAAAAKIQAFPSNGPTEIAAYGLTVRSDTRTPVPNPTDQPVISVNRLLPLEIELRAKSLALDSSRLPFGSIAWQIWAKIDGTAPVGIEDCQYLGMSGKRLFNTNFLVANAGKKIYFLSRYVTRTGKVGPSSALLTTTIPG